MTLFKIADIPTELRPFFPYSSVEDNPKCLSLEKNGDVYKYFFLLLALLNLTTSIVLSRLVDFAGFGLFSFSFALSVLNEGPVRIIVTIPGVQLEKKILFLTVKEFTPQHAIQSVVYSIDIRNEKASYGRVWLNKAAGRQVIVVRLARKTRTELDKDTFSIATKIGNILGVPVSRSI